jgi:hypothetical protein
VPKTREEAEQEFAALSSLALTDLRPGTEMSPEQFKVVQEQWLEQARQIGDEFGFSEELRERLVEEGLESLARQQSKLA